MHSATVFGNLLLCPSIIYLLRMSDISKSLLLETFAREEILNANILRARQRTFAIRLTTRCYRRLSDSTPFIFTKSLNR